MLAIRVLGTLEVERDQVRVDIRGRMVQALLVRLALEPGAVVSIDALVDALWADAPPAGATNAIQVKVSDLRRSIGTSALISRRPGYLLDVPPEAVDALAAERLITEARRQVTTDPRAAAALFARALALWRGPALASVGDAPFAAVAAVRWQELQLAAVEERARLELAAGRTRPLIAELEAAVAEHPRREPLVEVLMLALGAEGRQVAALAAYRDLRGRLVSELGIDPSPRLQELERRVLLQDPSVVLAVPVAPPAEELRPVGTPVGGDLRVRLPHPVSSFVRRDDDVEAVGRLLANRRLVTITGPGGVGKTRLAIEVARTVPVPTGGVWFVPLEAVASVQRVPDAVATLLGAVGLDAASALRARLRDAELVLVLDNCEHLGDALAPIVDDLLQSAPGLRCLTTSQRTLGVPGEAHWPLGPLDRARAVELFIERARDAAPHVSFDDHELVASLCEQLDNLPLAIELAAGRCGVLSVREIRDRLHDRFSLLRDARQRRSPRQQTLDATISWSYELLFPDGQLALQALAAFVGGADLAGLEAVLAGLDVPKEETLELVTQLVDRSLVVADQSGGAVRYRMLEGIRSFAASQALREERSPLIARLHATWAAGLAAQARWGVRSAQQRAWLARVRVERANIDAALDCVVAAAPTEALRMVADLYLAWMMLGDSEAGATRALQALAASGAGDPDDLVALAEASAAQLLARSGSVDRAVVLGQRAQERIGGAGPGADQVEVASILGRVLIHAGRFDEGCALVAEAAVRFVALGDEWGEAMARISLGWARYLGGRPDEAAEECRRALAALASVAEGWVTHAAHRLLGVLATEAGDYPTAFAEYDEALAVAHSMGSTTDVGQIHARIAWAHGRAGDADAAAASYRSALSASRLAGDHLAVDAVLRELDALGRRSSVDDD